MNESINNDPLNFTSCDKCKKDQTTKGTEQLFLKSVSIWVNKPHVVNRRLCGSKINQVYRLHSKTEVLEVLQNNCCRLNDVQEHLHFTDLADETTPFVLIIRELVPKSEFFPKLLEAVVYDKERASVSFIPVGQDCVGVRESIAPTFELKYCFQFQKINETFPAWAQVNEIFLSWSCDHEENEETRRQLSSHWLHSTLLEKLVIWSHINDISTSATSLTLVPIDKYKDTYVRLKNCYGRDLVKNWTERTDPKKFVYEDVAIAAYLLLIWEEDRKKKGISKKQSFVDLGCGNGLLVYILTKEGHKGLGIDLRKRNIWDTFGPDIDLRVETISPSADHLFPDYDWIIGNHSDELTPWIPVIAARSSYDCCFFVLPCCHHDFVGKFGVSEKGKSRYESYLDYVKEIVSYCGFHPESDTLRIPSTKRICFIGRARKYKKEEEPVADVERQAFIDKRTTHSHSLISHRQKYPYIPAKRAQSAECSQLQGSDPGSQGSQASTQGQGSQAGTQGQGSEATCQTERLAHPPQLKPGDSSDVDMELNYEPDVSSAPGQISNPLVTDKRKCDNLDPGPLQRLDATSHQVKKIKNSSASCRHIATDSSGVEQANTDNTNTQCSAVTCAGESANSYSSCEKVSESMDSSKSIGNDSVDGVSLGGAKQWAAEFQPRAEERVRNCQSVPEHIKLQIVSAVFQLVLNAPDAVRVTLETGRTWRRGGSVPLNQVAELFDKPTLHALKSECGGLQTLLRNHSHVFQVTGGQVQLRDFTQADPWKGRNPNKLKGKQQRDTRKTTLCWFHVHHPEGCPRPSDECQFAHGQIELKRKEIADVK